MPIKRRNSYDTKTAISYYLIHIFTRLNAAHAIAGQYALRLDGSSGAARRGAMRLKVRFTWANDDLFMNRIWIDIQWQTPINI